MGEHQTDFDLFFDAVAPRLRIALAARYGPEIGAEAASEAMLYAWEHWGRVQAMVNPAGYLYRVGQSAVRRLRPLRRVGGDRPVESMPTVEPGLDLTPILAAHLEDYADTIIRELSRGVGP